jgi:purine-binding chemotaxis protein CheW
VQEIIRVPEINSVPQAPHYVEGIVSLRNRLLPIVNLRKRFGLEPGEIDREDNRIIVVNLSGSVTGVLVDAVSEVLSVPTDAIEAPPRIIGASQAEQLRGVAKLDAGKRLIMLLDAAKVLSVAEAQELAGLTHGRKGKGREISLTAVEGQALDEEQFVSFRVESEEFAVDIQQVQEIIQMTAITRVPQAPHYVEGVINLRGNVLPVIDIRKRFGMAEAEATDSTSIVVVDVGGAKTGVIVDAVQEVLRLNRGAIEPPPAVVGGVDRSYVSGVGKRDGAKGMLIVLDIGRVLDEALVLAV